MKVNNKYVLITAVAAVTLGVAGCSAKADTADPSTVPLATESPAPTSASARSVLPTSSEAPSLPETVDDGSWKELGASIAYRGSGEYQLSFSDMYVDKDAQKLFDERRICFTKMITIDRFALPTSEDGFIAASYPSAKDTIATIDRQTTIVEPKWRIFPVDKDGNISSESLSAARPSKSDPSVRRDPPRTSIQTCAQNIPEDAAELVIVPSFEESRTMKFTTKDDAHGWRIKL